MDEKNKKRISFGYKLAAFELSALMLFVVTVGFVICWQYRVTAVYNYVSAMHVGAESLASAIDGDEFVRTMREKKRTEHSEEIRALFERAVSALGILDIYAVAPDENGEYRYFASAAKDVPPGTKPDSQYFAKHLEETVYKGLAGKSKVYKYNNDGKRDIVTGFGPIRDSSGGIVGAVAFDLDAERVVHSIARYQHRIVVSSTLLGLVLSALLIMLTKRRFGAPIHEIALAANSLAEGDTNIPSLPRSNDEIGELAESMESVARSLNTLMLGVDKLSVEKMYGGREEFANMEGLTGRYLQVAQGVNKALTILDNIDSVVYVTRLDGEMIFCNRVATEIFKLDEIKIDGRKCYEVLGGFSEPCPICPLPKLIASGSEMPSVTEKSYNPNFDIWLGVHAALIRWVDGSIVHLSICKDITLEKHYEKQQEEYERGLRDAAIAALEASRLKSSFLANMSHEIRTPMNGIIGFAELAIDDPDTNANTRDYFEKIRISAEGLLQIINDILDVSKIEAGRFELEKIPFYVREVFDVCEAISSPKALEKGLKLFFYPEPVVSKKLLGDPTRLRQILLNLISNAIKFTDTGVVKVICRSVETSDENVTIYFEVADTGVGMNPVQIERVFEPFSQGDIGTTRKYGGTGLGLSITKSLVDMMGGSLEVESAVGRGSKFGFMLPFDIADENDGSAKSDSPQTAKIVKPLFDGEILVCEDNPTNRDVIVEHLRRVGLRPTTAENGLEGVELVRSRKESGNPFDLILMDIQMPVMDGLEATARIEAMGIETPIVAMTANVMKHDKERYHEMGMKECLPKPFRLWELWSCLMRYLDPVATTSLESPGSHQERQSGGALDRSEGLENASGSIVFYEKLLRGFYADNRHRYDEIMKSFNAGDIATAHRLCHSMKSSSRLVGAKELSAAAARIEEMLEERADSLTEGDFSEFKNALERALAEMAYTAADPQQRRTPDVSRALDPAAALTLIDKLMPLLERSDTECLEMKDEIESVLGPAGSPVGELLKRMEDYDFDLALEVLRRIRSGIAGV